MTTRSLIDAHNALAEAHARMALELEASEQPQPPVSGSVAGAAGSAPPRPAALDTSMCPKHLVPFKPSKNPEWPAYCTSTSDDPAWSNAKGYCRINSRNAGEWLAVNGKSA